MEEERIGPKRIGPNLCARDLRRDRDLHNYLLAKVGNHNNN